MKPDQSATAAQLMKYIVAHWISKPVYVAAELGVADLLAQRPMTIDELARATGTHAPSLYRVMRALACIGVFSESGERRFELSPMGELLKTGAMRSVALMFNSDWSDRAWGSLIDGLKTGETAFDKSHGMTLSEWLEANPSAARVFNEANAAKAAGYYRAIAEVYDFSGIRTLTDVGGGLGIFLSEVVAANPSMRGTLAEIPTVVERARRFIRARGIEDRCRAVECDFFQLIPSGSDVYVLSHILHDWPDDRCRTILDNCRRAMNAESRLLVVEMIVPSGNAPSVAKLLDLEMLVMTGGRERTDAEFKNLFESAGLRLARIIPTGENVCVIEGFIQNSGVRTVSGRYGPGRFSRAIFRCIGARLLRFLSGSAILATGRLTGFCRKSSW